MPTYRTKGIIIKRIDFSEADRIVTIFTDNMGKVRAIAKGVRRTSSKMGGHLELFNVVDLMLAQGKNLEVVTSVHTKQNFSEIAKDLNKTSLAYYIIELVDSLTPDEHKDTRIFNLMAQSLKLINQEKLDDDARENLIIQTFKLKLLELLGYEPQFAKCTQCSKEAQEGEVYCFSNLLGGLVCHGCKGHDKLCFELSSSQLKILRVLLRDDIDLIARLDLEGGDIKFINNILDNYIKFIIEKEPKSLGFINKVSRLPKV